MIEADGREGDLPDAVREAEQEGPERPLITEGLVGKLGVALLAILFLGLVIVVTIFLLRVAKFPWLA